MKPGDSHTQNGLLITKEALKGSCALSVCPFVQIEHF